MTVPRMRDQVPKSVNRHLGGFPSSTGSSATLTHPVSRDDECPCSTPAPVFSVARITRKSSPQRDPVTQMYPWAIVT
jgi:hypothetical protein